MKKIIPRGAVAIISALLISFILTAYALLESTSTIWARAEQTNYSLFLRARSAAYSCGYEALLAYEEDASSTSSLLNKTLPLYDCTIDKIVSNSSEGVTIYTSAHIQDIFAYEEITASTTMPSGTLHAITWRDITSIPP